MRAGTGECWEGGRDGAKAHERNVGSNVWELLGDVVSAKEPMLWKL